MYKICRDFGVKDLLHLIEDDRKRFLGKFAYDENVPVSYFLREFKWRVKDLLNKSIVRLALKNVNGEMDCVALVKKSGFDSKVLGINVGKVEVAIVNSKIARYYPAELTRFFDEVREGAASRNVDVIFARIGLEQLVTVQCLQNAGALLTDILLTFYRNIQNEPKPVNLPSSPRVEKAERNDEQELMAISRKVFKVNHFHGDPRLLESKADELYAVWISNALKQPNNEVLVVRKKNEILGFILCRIENISNTYNYGVIDLIGVKEEHRNVGLGSLLVVKALEWFSGITRSVYVGTQASNYDAIRIYQKAGFRQTYSECNMHLWVNQKGMFVSTSC